VKSGVVPSHILTPCQLGPLWFCDAESKLLAVDKMT